MKLRSILAYFLLTPIFAVAGGKTVYWKQEVLLQDGRVIIVDRISKQSGKIIPENVILEYEQTLTFINPDTGDKIAWTIPKGVMPRMLDFENGDPYIVFRTSSVADYNEWGCPNPPLIVFYYKDSEWKQLPNEALPLRFTFPNMLDSAHSADRLSDDGLLTVSEMHNFLMESQFSDRRIIDRKKISPISIGCFEGALYRLGRGSEIIRGRR